MIVAEQQNGEIKKNSYEIASKGKEIADALGVPATLILIGDQVKNQAEIFYQYGVAKVLIAEHVELNDYNNEVYASVVESACKEYDPKHLILGATAQGKDLAATLAGRFRVGLAQDCTELTVESGKLIAIRPVYAGKAYAVVEFGEQYPQIATLRPNTASAVKVETSNSDIVEEIPYPPSGSDYKSKIRQVVRQNENMVDITEADVIVSGGRGLKSTENFDVIEKLAKAINGSVGASRSAVDAGWRPFEEQVGQTGKVVSPNLYVACGISGAVQHLAGMSTSKTIVAINKDPEAPIFDIADYGVVDDLFEVLPALIEDIEKNN